MNKLLAANVKRSIDMTGGAINIIVPAGQVYEILSMNPTTVVTQGQRWSLAVDGKNMFWSPADANFDPLSALTTIPTIFKMQDYEELTYKRIPILACEGQTITLVSTDNSGVVLLQYRIWTLESGLTEDSDGGLYGKKRIIFSHAIQTQSILAGATNDVPILTPVNAPGETTFPWSSNVPPDRKYSILGLFIGVSNTVGTNLARNGVRMLHEGRELVSPAGIVQTPANACPIVFASALANIFPVPYEVNNFEQVQVFLRVTSSDGGPQTATLYAGLLLIEEFLK